MSSEQATLTPMRRRAVDRLLIDYLELPEREQPAWLAQTRRRLPRLGRWLVQLIDDSHTVTLLDESVRRLAGQSVDRMEISVTRLVSGDRLGPWKVIEEVGQGGMGRVYRGQRADGAFEMDVAIKQIGQRRRGLAELLQRECRLLAKLDHPSVTRLVDAGLDDRAGPFLVMEWVEGRDLADWIERQQPDVETRLKHFERIAEAVAHAHQRLIVHGDIKPDNVRIRDDGSVKLMDFGVARLLESSDADQAGMRALTPAFAAPEQRDGENITPASDIWSLGTLLLWLLTGLREDEILAAHPSRLNAGTRLRNQELAAIIEKARAQRPQERYRSIDEFVGDLIRFRLHEPVSVMPSTLAYRAGRFVRRNRVLVGGVGASFLGLSIGLVMTVWMYTQAEKAREQAERHAREVEQIADFQAGQLSRIDVEGMGAGLRHSIFERRDQHLRLEGLDPEVRQQRQTALANALLGVNFTDLAVESLDQHFFRHGLETIQDQFHDQPIIRARLLQTLAEAARDVGVLELARQAQDEALDLREQNLGRRHVDSLKSRGEAANLAVLEGDYERALRSLEEVSRDRQETLGPDHPDTLGALNDLGTVNHYLNELETALAQYSRALAGRQRILGEEHPDTLASMLHIGVLHRWRGEYDLAMTFQRPALDGFRNVLGEDDPKTIGATSQMGYLLAEQGQLEAALPYIQASKHAYRRTLGDRHPQTLYTISDVGVMLLRMGRTEEAGPYLKRALDGRVDMLGPDHPHVSFSLDFMSHYHERMGDFEQAERNLRELIALRTQLLSATHSRTAIAMRRLGEALQQVGRTEEAIEWAGRAARNLTDTEGANHPQTVQAWISKARALLHAEQYERALEAASQAVDGSKATWPQGDRLVGQALRTRAMARIGLWDLAEAEADFLVAWDNLVNSVGETNADSRELAGDIASFYRQWQRLDPDGSHEAPVQRWAERAGDQ
ncbi:MAG: serine/threonine protein kinase [Wenzhouxiangella sp.]|nr:serine/threonine protein kinase [Wenzhouxiangella sp.]